MIIFAPRKSIIVIMENSKTENSEEKHSLSFVEQFVKEDLANGKTVGAYRRAFPQSPTAICI